MRDPHEQPVHLPGARALLTWPVVEVVTVPRAAPHATCVALLPFAQLTLAPTTMGCEQQGHVEANLAVMIMIDSDPVGPPFPVVSAPC